MNDRVRLLTILPVLLLACSESATGNGPGTPVSVTVTPSAVAVQTGSPVAFSAAVTGAAVTSVAWSVVEPAGGTVDGAGRYTAPGAAGVFHVRAASVADPSASGSAEVTVTTQPPVVSVTLSPPSAVVHACLTTALSATVVGSGNQAVAWSVQEGAAGGSVSQAGVYTAPAVAGVYHVIATSAADAAASASAALTVDEHVFSVQVSPATVALPASGAVQLTATVTTTCGSFPSTAQLTAGGQVIVK
jgi:hypothetical protein